MSTEQRRFFDLGVSPTIAEILETHDISSPTPIQLQSIPVVLEGSDVLGVAQTGTGKSLAFILPILQQIYEEGFDATATALFVLPTRELAHQLQETCRWFEKSLGVQSLVVVGGSSMTRQIKAIKQKPQIIIATPGRLNDLIDQKKLRLHKTKFIVLDEADRMFDMGFKPQIERILKAAPSSKHRQMMLFSATMPPAIIQMIREHMREPVHIEVAVHGSTAKDVEQEMIVLERVDRKKALVELLEDTVEAVIVFTRTKYQAKNLNKWLRKQNFKSEELHGNRSQPQRKRSVDALQKKQSRILVATDIAARGIDIPHVELVVNFDLPDQVEDYVHRIGRTGRAGRSGRAVSFVCIDQVAELNEIQRLINAELKEISLSSVKSKKLVKGPKKIVKKKPGSRRDRAQRNGRKKIKSPKKQKRSSSERSDTRWERKAPRKRKSISRRKRRH